MIWFICTLVSSIFLLAGIVIAAVRWRRDKNIEHWITPSIILFIFVGIAAVTWFLPFCLSKIPNPIFAFIAAIQSALRLFVVDDGFVERIEEISLLSGFFKADASYLPYYIRNMLNEAFFKITYYAVGGILFLLAPALTFHMVITFIKNLMSKIKYACSPKKNVHIFSELNEKSLALAASMANSKEYKRAHGGRPVIVFADIIDKKEEGHLDLIAGAKNINAILFRLDLSSIRFSKRGNKTFYLISDDEAEKIRHTTYIIEKFKKNKKTRLFVFSDSTESKCLLDSYTEKERNEMGLKVIRVNDIRSLIYHNLKNNGLHLFENANTLPDGTREISAVIVGLGKYGMEELKALLWYCQFPGYSVRIVAIDEDEDAKERTHALCPAIDLDREHTALGDMKYYVNVISARVGTTRFNNIIRDLPNPTYIFISLGDDATNVSTAIDIRSRLAAQGKKPAIETVVYDNTLKQRLNWEWDAVQDESLQNDMQKYNIHIIGDLNSFYSYKTVIASDFIQQGFATHRRWDKAKHPENNFYMNDYNFFSSMASTLHRNLREQVKQLKDDKKTLFPAIYHDAATSQPWASPSILFSVIEQTGTNESLHQLSDKMKLMASFLYSKLANIHYTALSPEQRSEVLKAIEESPEKDKPTLAETEKILNELQLSPTHLVDGTMELLLESWHTQPQEAAAIKKCSCPPDLEICQQCKKFHKCKAAKEWIVISARRDFIRSLFDFIVNTQYKKQGKNIIKSDFAQRYEFSTLSPEDKQDVRNYLSPAELRDLDYNLVFVRGFAYIEHIRWNAYMRAEGHSFFNNCTRKDRKYKLHECLVPVEKLTDFECIKDI